jgi:hypothetical protein
MTAAILLSMVFASLVTLLNPSPAWAADIFARVSSTLGTAGSAT